MVLLPVYTLNLIVFFYPLHRHLGFVFIIYLLFEKWVKSYLPKLNIKESLQNSLIMLHVIRAKSSILWSWLLKHCALSFFEWGLFDCMFMSFIFLLGPAWRPNISRRWVIRSLSIKVLSLLKSWRLNRLLLIFLLNFLWQVRQRTLSVKRLLGTSRLLAPFSEILWSPHRFSFYLTRMNFSMRTLNRKFKGLRSVCHWLFRVWSLESTLRGLISLRVV